MKPLIQVITCGHRKNIIGGRNILFDSCMTNKERSTSFQLRLKKKKKYGLVVCTSALLFTRLHHSGHLKPTYFPAVDGSAPRPCHLTSPPFGWNSNLPGSGPKSLFTQFALSLGLIRWCWKDDGLRRLGSVFSLCWSLSSPLAPWSSPLWAPLTLGTPAAACSLFLCL